MPLNWIETATGQKFDPTNPRLTAYNTRDIAPALSKICRYNGQTKMFYSVAEHSVHLARYLQKQGHNRFIVRTALMHDASEAYVGDLVVCMKHLLPEFKKMEERVMECISETFGLIYPIPEIVHQVDQRILVDERDFLMSDSGNNWPCDTLERLGINIQCWSPPQAQQEFMSTYRSTSIMDSLGRQASAVERP